MRDFYKRRQREYWTDYLQKNGSRFLVWSQETLKPCMPHTRVLRFGLVRLPRWTGPVRLLVVGFLRRRGCRVARRVLDSMLFVDRVTAGCLRICLLPTIVL